MLVGYLEGPVLIFLVVTSFLDYALVFLTLLLSLRDMALKSLVPFGREGNQ